VPLTLGAIKRGGRPVFGEEGRSGKIYITALQETKLAGSDGRELPIRKKVVPKGPREVLEYKRLSLMDGKCAHYTNPRYQVPKSK